MISTFFCLSSREDEMISDNAFSSPKNIYFKVLGNDLRSNFGGDSSDGMRFSPDVANCSFYSFRESRKTLIS